MKEDKDDFSSKYTIKDNTRKDEYPFELETIILL